MFNISQKRLKVYVIFILATCGYLLIILGYMRMSTSETIPETQGKVTASLEPEVPTSILPETASSNPEVLTQFLPFILVALGIVISIGATYILYADRTEIEEEFRAEI